jgi:hypothetical protein
VAFELTMIIFFVMYSYAAVGAEAFAGKIVDPTPASGGGGESAGGPAGGNWHATFDTFPRAYLTMFQLLTTSNWHEVMYAACQGVDTYWAALFFVSFDILSVTIVLNLVLAVVIETRGLYIEMEREWEEGVSAVEAASAKPRGETKTFCDLSYF